jgi:hypothetical protein
VPLLEYQQTALDKKRARGLTATELADTSGDESVRQQNQLGLTTLVKPDTVQADINKFRQKERNKLGLTASDRTDQELAGKKVVAVIDGKEIYGDPDVLPDPSKEIGPTGMTSPKKAQEIATDAARKTSRSILTSALEMRNINKKTSTEVKGLLDSFAERYKARAGNDPYKMQKFYFTLSAAMMEPGNAFANIPKGLSKAINELDATRKEKDKLLMDLDDTMTKAKVKLAGKEGEADIEYEKLNLTQKKMIDNLGPTGLAAFNKQMKANGDYIAALAAAKKAENAARRLDAKDKAKGAIKSADIKNLNDVFNNAFASLKPFYGIGKGTPMDKKQADYKASVMDKAVKIASGEGAYKGKTGMVAANSFIQNQARTYKKK